MNPSTETNKNIAKLNLLINEEKITRDFSSYQLSKVESYFQFGEEIFRLNNEEQSEILKILAEYKQENPKTVLGRLIPPYVAFKKNLNYDPSEEELLFELIVSVLLDFQSSTRWSLIIYITDKILALFPQEVEKLRNHPYITDVLRFKQDAVEKIQGKKETKSILKTILELDKKDADSSVKYAKLIHTEDPEEAGLFFKRAAEIYIKEKKIEKLEEIWKILTEEYYEDLKFFERIEKFLNTGKYYDFIIAYYPQLVEKYKEIEDWDTVISLLKKIIGNAIEQDKREVNARRLETGEKKIRRKEGRALSRLREELTKAYKNKYKKHSLLEVFLKASNITNPKIPIQISIANFEKYIVFDTGNYVYHRKRGIGKIKEINEQQIVVDFKDEKTSQTITQKMSLSMAISSLQALEPTHIWVRMYENLEEVRKLVKENKLEFFKILLESFNKKITLSQVKLELIGKGILESSEWNKWWQETRKILKESSLFGFNPKKRDEILMWERELTYAEELENKFNNVKEWDKKLEIALESLLVNPEITEKSSEAFLDYFLEQEETKDPIKKLEIYFYSLKFNEVYPNHTVARIKKNKKEEILNWIRTEISDEEAIKIFSEIKYTDFKKYFIDFFIESKENFKEILIKILLETPVKIHKYIIDKLNRIDPNILNQFFVPLFRKYKEYPELFLWVSKNILENDWHREYEWIDKSKEEVVLQLLRLLKYLDRIEKRGNKLKNATLDVIFGTQNISIENLQKSKMKKFIEEFQEDTIQKLYILFKDIPFIPKEHKENLLNFIKIVRPEIEILSKETIDIEEEREELIPSDNAIYVTSEAIQKFKNYLDHLINVELLENAKEIGEAQEKGDLRENAEYKAALERQDKLRAEIKKLEEELKKAKPIDVTKIRTDLITIGTLVFLKDQDGNSIQYKILGPWDADPEKNIISYASPLGKSLLGKKIGDKTEFGSEKIYTIEKIEKAIL
ncbi:MAG: GreA/GreB family elongation factor [Leptonema sp. (in: bacteria)]